MSLNGIHDLSAALESKIDRTDWQVWKFSDLVENIVEKVIPKDSGLEHYIGLEHLNSGSLKIRRFGETKSLIGDKLRIYKGDLIFAKRNAYLKRVSIAEFDAVVSAHSLVLRAKPENILPEFLPFFMLSEKFWQRAIEISVGSLSPTINWKVLARQEFLLPPKDQQAKLAELLGAMDEVIEKEKEVVKNLKVNIKAMQKKLFNKENFTRFKLENYAAVLGGYAFSSKSFTNSGVPVIKIKNIVDGKIVIDESSNHISPAERIKSKKYALSEDDILIAMTGATLGKIGVVQSEFDGALLNQRVGKFETKPGVNKSFLRGILDSVYFLNELNKYIGEGAQGNISSEDISKTLVPELGKSEMLNFGRKFKSYSLSLKQSLIKIKSSQCLLKSLINQIFNYGI